MSEFFPEPKSYEGKIQLDLCNYAAKTDLKNATCVDTSGFAKKADLSSLKCNEGQLDNDKLKIYQVTETISIVK